jgi:hypothetical protein
MDKRRREKTYTGGRSRSRARGAQFPCPAHATDGRERLPGGMPGRGSSAGHTSGLGVKEGQRERPRSRSLWYVVCQRTPKSFQEGAQGRSAGPRLSSALCKQPQDSRIHEAPSPGRPHIGLTRGRGDGYSLLRNRAEELDGLLRARPDRFPGRDDGLDALDTASQARMERFERRMPARKTGWRRGSAGCEAGRTGRLSGSQDGGAGSAMAVRERWTSAREAWKGAG